MLRDIKITSSHDETDYKYNDTICVHNWEYYATEEIDDVIVDYFYCKNCLEFRENIRHAE